MMSLMYENSSEIFLSVNNLLGTNFSYNFSRTIFKYKWRSELLQQNDRGKVWKTEDM